MEHACIRCNTVHPLQYGAAEVRHASFTSAAAAMAAVASAAATVGAVGRAPGRAAVQGGGRRKGALPVLLLRRGPLGAAAVTRRQPRCKRLHDTWDRRMSSVSEWHEGMRPQQGLGSRVSEWNEGMRPYRLHRWLCTHRRCLTDRMSC